MNKHYTLKQTYFLILALAIFLGGGNLSAQTIFFGTVSNEFNDAANWDNGLPGPGNDGTIFGAFTPVFNSNGSIDGNVLCYGSLTIASGAVVTNNANLNLSGTLTVDGEFQHSNGAQFDFNSVNVNAGGTLSFLGGSTITQTGGTLNNYGTITNQGNYTNNGSLINDGLFNNNSGGVLTTNKDFVNNATFNNNNNGTVIMIGNPGGSNHGTMTNNGLFENRVPIPFTFINETDGTFINNGTLVNINGSLTENYGNFENAGNGTVRTVGTVDNYGIMTNNGTFTAPNGGYLNNKAGGTFFNNSDVTNLQIITNDGTVHNNSGSFTNDTPGQIFNNKTFINELPGLITNNFEIYNNDYFQNIGRIENGVRIFNSGTFDNNGILNNIGCFSNYVGSTLNNDQLNGAGGVIDNLAMGYISNAGTFNNSNEVFIHECSSLVNEVGGVINNSYWFTINGLFWNYEPGQPNNTGAGGVFYYGQTITGTTSSDICEDITASLDANGNALILGSGIAISTLDNCEAFILEVDNQNFTCTDLGPNLVTLTLSHKTQTVDCTATVTIVDNENPTLTSCPNDILVTTSTGSAPATWSAPNASDNCSVTLSSTHNSGDIFPLGMTTVTYTAVDQSGNMNSCSFKVTVVADGDCADIVSARKVLNTQQNCGTGNPYIMWLQGGVTYTAGDDVIFVEYNNGTALLTGSIFKNGQRGYVEVMYTGFTSSAPSGSPKTNTCVTSGHADWKYYTSMSGYFTMENGVTCEITRRGPAFQYGTGANLQEVNSLGGSGWFDTNENTTGDFNFNLGSTLNCQNSIYLEAECANSVGSKWSVINDGSASNGMAVLPPAGQISYDTPPTSTADLLTYNVSVVQGGKYRLYFRSVAPDGSADSYWVQVNNGAWQKWNKVNSDNYSTAYEWDIVGHWDGGSWDIPNTFQLNPGSNTIKVSWREPGLKLDKIFVTYLGKRPTGQGEAATNCNGNPPPSTCETVSLTIQPDNYGADITWKLKNSAGQILYQGGPYIDGNTTPITVDFCLADGCFDFEIYDSYGDGLCCQYGNGFYELKDASGQILAQGAQYTNSDFRQICINQPGGGGGTCNQTALFVVGDAYLNPGDLKIKNRLQALGYTVTVKDDDVVQTSHAAGKGIIVISSSIYSGKVNTKFKDTAVPVVVWEQWLFDDMRMTGTSSSNYGTWSSTNKIHITNASHPITSGYSGDLTILTANKTIGWGMPVGGGVSLGHAPGVSQKSMLFTYETGVQMNGMTAPARRVGMFMRNGTPNCLNNNGWLLFDQVIAWAADCTLISPYVSNDNIELQAQATNDRKVNLAWTFNTAYSTEYMMLQRSTDDGETFETINEWYVWEEENTDTKAFLETDLTPAIGENLYRIKLVNLNGEESFSNIPVIEFVDMVDFAVFPNPTIDYVEINLEKLVGATDVNISITDWTGRLVQENQIDEVIGYTERIELKNYRSGTYAITVTTEGQRPVTRKLIIAK